MSSDHPFEWDCIGDLQVGRPNLGDITSVTVYRLFQFSIRHVLEARFGVDEADAILRQAGRLAGKEFAATQLDRSLSAHQYLHMAMAKMEALRIGVLQAEKADLDRMEFTLTVSEDLDCSGVPVTGRSICSFDEGFIAGIFERFSGRHFEVKEIDCWATGAKTCRFSVKPS